VSPLRIARRARWALTGGAVAAELAAFTAWHSRRARRRYPPAGDFVEVEGARLHYVDRGAGRPVVLLHGLKGSVNEFTYSVMDALAEKYRAIAFDRSGYGHSERTGFDGSSPLVQARQLHAALAKLSVERPVLVGHSMGAATATAYAVQYQGGLAGLVTLAGHTLPFDGPIGLSSQLAGLPLVGPLFVHTLVTPFGLLLAPLVLRGVLAPQRPPRDYARAAAWTALRPGPFTASADDAHAADDGLRLVYHHYPHLDLPVVIVHGRDDHVLSPNESLSFHRLVPGSEFIELSGCGHMPFFCDPGAVVAAIDRAWQLADARA